jgi:hypothetical protein
MRRFSLVLMIVQLEQNRRLNVQTQGSLYSPPIHGRIHVISMHTNATSGAMLPSSCHTGLLLSSVSVLPLFGTPPVCDSNHNYIP